MNSKVYKWCVVPQCTNTSLKTPNKLFIYVPHKKTVRDKWLKLARRDPAGICTNSPVYFCEDHFDLPNDMENYMQYYLMGSVSQVRMKPESLPKKFECQPDRKKRTSDTVERPYLLKKQRMMAIEECEKQLQESSTVPERLDVAKASGSSGKLPTKREMKFYCQISYSQMLELVQRYPCLWDRKDAHYMSKTIKKRCRAEILEIINKLYATPMTMDQLKHKINYTQRKLYHQSRKVKPSTNDDNNTDQQIPPNEEGPAIGENTQSDVCPKKSPTTSSSVTTSKTTTKRTFHLLPKFRSMSNDKGEEVFSIDLDTPSLDFMEIMMTKRRRHGCDPIVAKNKKLLDAKVPDGADISKTISNVESLNVVKTTLRGPQHLNTGGKSDVAIKFAVCRICLSDKEQLMVITNLELQRVYQKLTLLPFLTSDARPQTACLMCINLLRTAHKLMANSLQAEEWFTYTLAGVDVNKTVQPSSSKLSVVETLSLTISSRTTEANESIDINEGSVSKCSKKDSAVCNSEATSLLIQCGISDSVVPKTEYIPAEDEQKTPGHSDASSDDGHLVYDIVKVEPDLEELVDFNDFSDVLGQTDQEIVDNVANNALNTERTIKRANVYSNLDTGSTEVERDLRHAYSFGIHVNMKAELEDETSNSESPNSKKIATERITEPKTYISMDSEQPGINDAHSGGSKGVRKDLRQFGIQVSIKTEPEDEKRTSESPNSDNVGDERIVAPKTYISMVSEQPGINDAHSGGSKGVRKDLRQFGIQVSIKTEPEDEKRTSESPNSDNVGEERIVAPKTYISMDSEQPYGTNDEDLDSDEEILKIADNFLRTDGD